MMPDVSVPGDTNNIIDNSLGFETLIRYMSQETNPQDRMVRLYFGRPGEMKPSKEEVGEFIKTKMGLVRTGGEPRWSEGLCELIALGMDAWYQGQVERANLVSPERVEKLEERTQEQREKIADLQQQLAREQRDVGRMDAVDAVHQTEASILKVLCRDEHIGAKSPNYVSIPRVSEVTGLDYDTITHYAEMLSKPAFGEHVEMDRFGENIKATSQEAYDEYCEAAGIDGVSLDE